MDEDEILVLAGEYVLGLLAGEELAQAEADPRFPAAVRVWHDRLMVLAETVPPATPPARVWAKISATISPRVAVRRRVWWLSGLAGAAAAAVLLWLMQPAPPRDIATLTTASAGRFDVRVSATALIISPEIFSVPAGKSAELWLIAPHQAPKPLGLLDAHAALAVARPHGTGLVLAVSLEPPGGSPTGLPTGPVIGEVLLTKL
jgi:anti-sigma-K factor RskA